MALAALQVPFSNKQCTSLTVTSHIPSLNLSYSQPAVSLSNRARMTAFVCLLLIFLILQVNADQSVAELEPPCQNIFMSHQLTCACQCLFQWNFFSSFKFTWHVRARREASGGGDRWWSGDGRVKAKPQSEKMDKGKQEDKMGQTRWQSNSE